jgi:hypothetical protein
MPIYINRNRAHDQGAQTRRYSEERAEWYDSLRHAFNLFCDRLTFSEGRIYAPGASEIKGFRNPDHFREEGLKVIEGNTEFWTDEADLADDSAFAEAREILASRVDPNMTLEALQEMLAPERKTFFMGGYGGRG